MSLPLFFVVDGQSNVIVHPNFSWTPAPNLYVWNNALDGDSVGSAYTTPDNTVIGVCEAFGQRIAQRFPTRNVYMLNVGLGNQAIEQWLGLGNPNLYALRQNNQVLALAAAGTTHVSGQIWWQGDNNISDGAAYFPKLNALQEKLISGELITRATLSMFCGISAYFVSSQSSRIAFNVGLNGFATANKYRSFVDISEVPEINWNGVHMLGTGYDQAGQLIADYYMYKYYTVCGVCLNGTC